MIYYILSYILYIKILRYKDIIISIYQIVLPKGFLCILCLICILRTPTANGRGIYANYRTHDDSEGV